ncbi:PsbP-related protein [Winogradskyella luteola]|uniref:DUF1795 domain-containing protein n=1 Tax=Winogradskyella luteola TaxID=2828330 RepID=A0A9X1JPE4_9FLAO|nr:PsbP-related protein [Winogradskyella luteola]MBV7270640.1 hypothetical protein [Winogradskyella luteola]
MKFIKLILLFTIILSCQNNKIDLDRENFELTYPSYLSLDESGEEGTIFYLYDNKENDIFTANFNLVSIKKKSMTFLELTQQIEKETKNYGRLISSEEMRVVGQNFFRIVMETEENNVVLKSIQHFYPKGESIYILTFLSEKNYFDKHYNKIDEVMMSFRLK